MIESHGSPNSKHDAWLTMELLQILQEEGMAEVEGCVFVSSACLRLSDASDRSQVRALLACNLLS